MQSPATTAPAGKFGSLICIEIHQSKRQYGLLFFTLHSYLNEFTVKEECPAKRRSIAGVNNFSVSTSMFHFDFGALIHYLLNSNRNQIMKYLKKAIVVSTIAVLPLASQAMTQQQWQNLVYGAVAAGAWGSWGAINTLISHFVNNPGRVSAADWGNIAGTLCGSAASGALAPWNPPTTPISKTNIALGTVRAGSVIGASTSCRWITVPIASKIINMHNDADSRANGLSPSGKNSLNADVSAFESQKANLTSAFQYIKNANTTLIATQSMYNAHNCSSLHDQQCQLLQQNLIDAKRDMDNSQIYARQMAWDIAQTLVNIGAREGEPLNRIPTARPVQHP